MKKGFLLGDRGHGARVGQEERKSSSRVESKDSTAPTGPSSEGPEPPAPPPPPPQCDISTEEKRSDDAVEVTISVRIIGHRPGCSYSVFRMQKPAPTSSSKKGSGGGGKNRRKRDATPPASVIELPSLLYKVDEESLSAEGGSGEGEEKVMVHEHCVRIGFVEELSLRLSCKDELGTLHQCASTRITTPPGPPAQSAPPKVHSRSTATVKVCRELKEMTR